MDSTNVLRFVSERQLRGEAVVLVTVGAVEGSSMRGPGTLMGVAADGSFAGSLSGGCIETAVVSEALEALGEDAVQVVRFGAGSPYLDIKLPCGGGLDLHFCPLGDSKLAEQCLAAIHERRPFSITLSGGGAAFEEGWQAARFDPASGDGVFGYWPAPIIQIVGHGAGVEALARQARAFGCWAKVYSPDQRIIDMLHAEQVWAYRLSRTDQTDVLTGDRWTANVFLFHDHDWEIDLMVRAFDLPHFYLGAMGGRRAHEQRCEALRARGITEEQLASIHAPIGLFHSSRDPQTLALSTLAQVIRVYGETDFGAALG